MKNLKKKIGLALVPVVVIVVIFSLMFANVGATGSTTWNPSDCSQYITLSDGNLTATGTHSDNFRSVRATNGKTTGKWYWEVKPTSAAIVYGKLANIFIGVTDTTATFTGTSSEYVAQNGKGVAYTTYTGQKCVGGTWTDYGATCALGDVIGIALDLDTNNGEVTFYKNGTSMGVAITDLKNNIATAYPALSFYDYVVESVVIDVNFGATSFAYPIPTGFSPYDGAPATATPTVTPTPEPTVTPTPTSTPTPTPPPASNKALVVITYTNNAIKEFDLSASELNDFITWFNNKSNGIGSASYAINVHANVSPYTSRKEYVLFDKIVNFEVKEYNQ